MQTTNHCKKCNCLIKIYSSQPNNNEGKENSNDGDLCNIPYQMNVCDGKGQEKCTIKGLILNQTIVNIDTITIKLDTCQSRSLFDRKLKTLLLKESVEVYGMQIT